MPTSAASPSVPPIPFVVASWLGYPLERIVAGLQRGSIAPPPGAPPGWLPAGAVAPGVDADGDADVPTDATDDVLPAVHDDVDSPSDAAALTSAAGDDLRATYQALVRAIDPSVTDQRFEALWIAGGRDEQARAASLGDLLWRTVTGAPAAADAGDAEAIAAAIEARGTRGTLVSLAAEGSEALARRARSDPAVLGALVAADAYAFAGVDGVDTGIGRWRFDPATGEALLSDDWIDDRAKFVAWREALGDGPAAAQGADGSWRFVDRTIDDGGTIVVGSADAPANQVVFAREGGDRVIGGAAVDRIHGGSGDDVLRGAAGDDLVEGARGDDVLSGGSGRDRVEGGAGADELAGGSNDDALDGGSGDDTLDGGRGDDTLRGGNGHDTYEFALGDGIDLVVDADGDGEILLDGERLTGDPSAGVSYVTQDDGAGGTTLVVHTGGDGAGSGEIRIRDWQQGELGIRLEDAADSIYGTLWTGVRADAPRIKPLVTDGGDASDAASGMQRESGNESGSGFPLDTLGSLGPSGEASQGSGRFGALELADWARAATATRRPADDAALTPPDVDPSGVTVADLASALAGATGDSDESDAAGPGSAPQLWPVTDDWSSAFVPPDAPARPMR
jgi:RTX calcium-binding nonapeptide repeat (4 copies)